MKEKVKISASSGRKEGGKKGDQKGEKRRVT